MMVEHIVTGMLLANADAKSPVSVLTPDLLAHTLRAYLMPRKDLVMAYATQLGALYMRDQKNGLRSVDGVPKKNMQCVAVFERDGRHYGIFTYQAINALEIYDLAKPKEHLIRTNIETTCNVFDSVRFAPVIIDDKGNKTEPFTRHLYYSDPLNNLDSYIGLKEEASRVKYLNNVEIHRIEDMFLVPMPEGLLYLIKESKEINAITYRYDRSQLSKSASVAKWLWEREVEDGVFVCRLVRAAVSEDRIRIYTCDVTTSVYLRAIIAIKPVSTFFLNSKGAASYQVHACAETNTVGVMVGSERIVLVDAEWGLYDSHKMNEKNINWLGILRPTN